MSDQEPAPDFNEAGFIWEDQTSALNKPYKVGLPKGEDGTPSANKLAGSGSSDNNADTNSATAGDDASKPPGWSVPDNNLSNYEHGQDVAWAAPMPVVGNVSSGTISDPGSMGGITKWEIGCKTVAGSLGLHSKPTKMWILRIETQNGWQYRFRDETDDWYTLRVIVTMWGHAVAYSSKKPSINRVEWYKPFI